MGEPTLQQLMTQLAIVRRRLAKYRVRDAADYAELLIAGAVHGTRNNNGTNQGFDIISSRYGRIEVKCRCLPVDGRREERIDLRRTKADGFDFLAIVIFFPDFSLRGAVLVPYAKIWPLIDSRQYRRISYVEACQLDGAIDITTKVIKSANRSV